MSNKSFFQMGCAYDKWVSPRYPRHYFYLISCFYAVGFPSSPGIMFKPGPPCSECPEGTTCKDNLCAIVPEETEGEGDEETESGERDGDNV